MTMPTRALSQIHKPYPITTAKPIKPKGFNDWIGLSDLSCSRHGLSHGNLLHSCFRSLSATFELLFLYWLLVATAHVI